MKTIGIILAMNEELNALKNLINITKEQTIYDLTFMEGKINNNKVILVKCGVGKVNAARTTQILIDNYKPNIIINTGSAGGIDNSLDVGDIVIGRNLIQYDFDITALNYKKGYILDTGQYFDSDKELINLVKNIDNKLENIKTIEGIIATADKFCTDKKEAESINKEFNALCVEMEGASVAQVCSLCKVPFIVLRSISDSPNNNNKITFEKFLELASSNVANLVKKLLEII